MKKKSLLTVLLAGASVVGLASCGGEKVGVGQYTYNSYTTALGKNWNPHAWETNAESGMLSYITSPFVDMSVLDSEEGVYQWVYEMATEVKDVTKDNKADLTKYKVNLPEGTEASAVEKGYVYEIKLNNKAKWETGEAIKADDYLTSMKLLLDPEMKNYRANLYVDGESALAGAYDYYYQGKNYGMAGNGYTTYDTANDDKLFFHWKKEQAKNTYFLNWVYDTYGSYVGTESYPTLRDFLVSGFGAELSKDDTVYTAMDGKTLKEIKENADWKVAWEELVAFWKTDPDEELTLVACEFEKPAVPLTDVGLYKVDDYTIRYVNKNQIDFNYFMTSLTSTWLVHEPTYTKLFDTTGKLKTTTYCTSKDTTVSYGPYKLESFEDGKQMVFVQNPNWLGYEEKEVNGKKTLVSYTNFKVDGEYVQQYQATKIVVDVMEDSTAKQKFMKGELDDWAPAASELSKYTTSPQLYKADETYQMSFFFNTDVEDLQAMDTNEGNQNSVVLSNLDFRKAFSLAINRSEWVTATAGYKPAYSLLNSLYFYNIYEDPTSSYRNSDQAKKAIVNLYGVEYGADKPYKTLDEAYNSITGYNLAEAKALMKQAHDALVAAGLYTSGQAIKIKIGYKKGALEADDNAQVELMNKYLNAAIEGSGFGKVTLEAVGGIQDRYGDVAKGKYAIGYGAWGGAAFYPFRNLQVYMDPDQYDINEAACWDPTIEKFKLTVNGEEVEMTYQDWSNSMVSTGRFANADFETKLNILSALEEDYLAKYYRIPLASSTSCSMLSYKLSNYTDDYNIMYGFGGLRLMKFNYDDYDWAQYVAKQGGNLSYEG